METRDKKNTRDFHESATRQNSHHCLHQFKQGVRGMHACHFLPEHAGEKQVGVKLRRLPI